MALTDIQFQSGEGQDFLVEIGAGDLNPPADMLTEPSSTAYPVMEVPTPSGGGNIFIMSE